MKTEAGQPSSSSRLNGREISKAWAPVVIWATLMFLASTDVMASAHTSRFLIPFLRWLKPDISLEAMRAIHFAIRKAAHVIEYAILTNLVWRGLRAGTALRTRPVVALATAFFLAVLFATSDEFHQSFVASRGAAIADVGFDSCGAFLAVITIMIWRTLRRGWT